MERAEALSAGLPIAVFLLLIAALIWLRRRESGFPFFTTVIVLAAVGVMIALGFWQLSRKAEKEALLARYERAITMGSEIAWPASAVDYASVLYRRTRIDCTRVEGVEAAAGRSETGRAGWAHVARCRLPDDAEARVALGWSDRPASPEWKGGEVGGVIAPAGYGIRLVASPAQAGLEQLAAPDPSTIPNNHLSYAVQWFAFAATAVVIYILALRRRRRDR